MTKRTSRGLCAAMAHAVALLLMVLTNPASAQDWAAGPPDQSGPGAAVWRDNCAACHATGTDRAPPQRYLQDMSPTAIHRALTEGVMRQQGAALTAPRRVAVAEYVTGRKLTPASAATENQCTGAAARFDFSEPPVFAGWGLDPASTHAISTPVAGLTRANVGRLKLKWAVGFADVARLRSHPTLAGGAILIGAHDGTVRAFDRATGCERWRFSADAEVRTGIVVAPWRPGDTKVRPLAWFGDVVGNVYAIDARSGAAVWKIAADTHPAATITARPRSTALRYTCRYPASRRHPRSPRAMPAARSAGRCWRSTPAPGARAGGHGWSIRRRRVR